MDMYGRVQNKLHFCRRELVKWKRRNKINFAGLIQCLKQCHNAAERNHKTFLTEVNLNRISLNQAYYNEKKFWRLKSRNTWLWTRDRNSKFFHSSCKSRKIKNRIKSIVDGIGFEHFRDDIGKVVEEYFHGLFTTTQITDLEDILSGIKGKVTQDMNQSLLQPVTEQEITTMVFSISVDRAYGHDGFTAAFYHQYWKWYVYEVF